MVHASCLQFPSFKYRQNGILFNFRHVLLADLTIKPYSCSQFDNGRTDRFYHLHLVVLGDRNKLLSVSDRYY
ncbi:unnamed protein product [Arctia plantaginis]|uniref:Uncharacterized protein n=1 Tax=Arctia plantaginis TaxID=874455 RepID=A0A8S1A489_ARCPL|nr:unnamed protein product [Arctia plantaginis]